MPVTEFQEKVYTLLAQIPAGRVTTYASLANALNTSPRAIGNALRNNPFAPEVPCHRCVASSGYVNGYNGEVLVKKGFKRTKDGGAMGKGTQSAARGVKKTVATKDTVVLETIPPSGLNISKKLKILKDEGVEFDGNGMLLKKDKVLFDGPWKL
jgi:methylated-DNA-[protein]-cysteine S-methyltransferase